MRNALWFDMTFYTIVNTTEDRCGFEVDIVHDPLTHLLEVLFLQVFIQVGIFTIVFNQNIIGDTATDACPLQFIQTTTKVWEVFHHQIGKGLTIELNALVSKYRTASLIELLS